jgi:hypothetical protein
VGGMRNREKIVFKETQQFRESWMWAIIIIVGTMAIAGMLVAGITKNSFEEANFIWGFVAVVIFEVLLYSLFYITNLETQITEEAVYYRWTPFMRKFKRIGKEEIYIAEIRKVPFLQRGFRIVPGYGKVYVVAGGKGMQFHLKSSKKIFIGTAEPFLFNKAIEKMMDIEH